ncbi:MAG: hypothetical protein HQL17_02865 [Candidatus Omnitrophica bacterium]|nr:hypothetical protein [Candidatus Omnitrophota bacterium]
MEPFSSIWGFTLLSVAAGAVLVALGKKKDASCVKKCKPGVAPKVPGSMDAAKEKEIDALISGIEDTATRKER